MCNSLEQIPTIYLASRSPRRVELLKQIGVACIPCPADIDETRRKGECAEAYVLRLAEEKARAALKGLRTTQDKPLLAADTTVALDGEVLGKPENDAEARSMLNRLSGSMHIVHTAIALAWMNKIDVILSTTQVYMMPLGQAQIEHYIETGEHIDKAGSYGIQGLAGSWIRRIEGSYSGVMGLPVFETAELLRKHGIIRF